MEPLYIAGIAMTVFGRHTARTLDDLAHDALDGALKDAGCSRADISCHQFGNGNTDSECFASPGWFESNNIRIG